MLSQFTRCSKKPLWRLSSAANKLFRRITQPAQPELVTGMLTALPHSRAAPLAESPQVFGAVGTTGRRGDVAPAACPWKWEALRLESFTL
jgi:hypothetical protein